jgi:hypothetical protein
MRIRVECYAGYRGEETPRRFFLGERAVEVREVVDRWLAPDHRYFKVRGSDGQPVHPAARRRTAGVGADRLRPHREIGRLAGRR